MEVRRYTIKKLHERGVLNSGSNVITLKIPGGNTVSADLNDRGSIIQGNRTWTTPSGFSRHFLNRRDNGWRSVRYNGTILNELRVKCEKEDSVVHKMTLLRQIMEVRRYSETTIKKLHERGVLISGPNVITLKTPGGNTVSADLNDRGSIILGNRTWTTPSGFSRHFLNRHDNGWKSVRYKGTILNEFRVKCEKEDKCSTQNDLVETVGIPESYILTHPKVIEMCKRETQGDCYRKKGSCEEIVQLADMNCKSYGKMEHAVRDYYGIKKTKTTENDGEKDDIKVEIKCPRINTNDSWMIQHLKKDHDFDVVVIALLTPKNGLRTMLISKSDVFKIAKPQKGEGWLVENDKLESHAVPLRKGDNLNLFAKRLMCEI